jgi:hypothetical protein
MDRHDVYQAKHLGKNRMQVFDARDDFDGDQVVLDDQVGH